MIQSGYRVYKMILNLLIKVARQYSKQKQTIPVTFIKLYMYQLFRFSILYSVFCILTGKCKMCQPPGLLPTSTQTASATETSSPRYSWLSWHSRQKIMSISFLQNLLLDPESGILKLCDFGSAKHLVRGEPNVSYICSRYYRSPRKPPGRFLQLKSNFFRAPELIFGATDYTTNIDVWSAGCVFAELMLGQVGVN